MKIEDLKQLAMSALEDLKAEDITVLDVKGKTTVTDWIYVASGSSSRHVKSIANSVVVAAKQADAPPLGLEGEAEGEWVLVDFGDVVVHVMLPATRDLYDLERLWTLPVASS